MKIKREKAFVIFSAALFTSTLSAAPVSITLPSDMTDFKTAKGSNLAAGYCKTCHSADYVYMQPPMDKTKWTATITKMKKVFGCLMQDSDVDALAEYLTGQNGPK
jgi:mono/diheme cytochrome c family protein